MSLQVGRRGDPLQFGGITNIAALPDGGVLIFDEAFDGGPVLLRLDSSGRMVQTIGRVGAGPGEYRRAVRGITANADGTIFLRDPQQSRVLIFDRRGRVLQTITAPPVSTTASRYIAPGPHGSFYVHERVGSEWRAENIVQYGPTGTLLQTIVTPALWFPTVGQQSFEPQAWFGLLPDGRQIAVRSDRLGFLLIPGGGAAPRWAEIVATAPEYVPEERSIFQAQMAWYEKYDRADIDGRHPAVPKQKQLLKGFLVDFNGRVWLERSATGVRRSERAGNPVGIEMPRQIYYEPPVYDGFLPNGQLLGEIRFPIAATAIAFGTNVAWAVMRDDEGVETVAKFSLSPLLDRSATR